MMLGDIDSHLSSPEFERAMQEAEERAKPINDDDDFEKLLVSPEFEAELRRAEEEIEARSGDKSLKYLLSASDEQEEVEETEDPDEDSIDCFAAVSDGGEVTELGRVRVRFSRNGNLIICGVEGGVMSLPVGNVTSCALDDGGELCTFEISVDEGGLRLKLSQLTAAAANALAEVLDPGINSSSKTVSKRVPEEVSSAGDVCDEGASMSVSSAASAVHRPSSLQPQQFPQVNCATTTVQSESEINAHLESELFNDAMEAACQALLVVDQGRLSTLDCPSPTAGDDDCITHKEAPKSAWRALGAESSEPRKPKLLPITLKPRTPATFYRQPTRKRGRESSSEVGRDGVFSHKPSERSWQLVKARLDRCFRRCTAESTSSSTTTTSLVEDQLSQQRASITSKVYHVFPLQRLAFERAEAFNQSLLQATTLKPEEEEGGGGGVGEGGGYSEGGARVWSFEGFSTGRRLFLASDRSSFNRRYWQTQASARHVYEVIPSGAPCRLYFDVEYDIESQKQEREEVVVDGDGLVDLLIHHTRLHLQLCFGVTFGREDVVELDSSSLKKFSRHLIFHLKESFSASPSSSSSSSSSSFSCPETSPPSVECLFVDNENLGAFVKSLIAGMLLDPQLSDKIPSRQSLWVEAKTTSGLLAHQQQEGGELSTEEQLLEAKPSTCIVDLGVYTKNRAFRLLGSRKYGPGKTTLRISRKTNKFSFPKSTQPEDDPRVGIFEESLVVPHAVAWVRHDPQTLVGQGYTTQWFEHDDSAAAVIGGKKFRFLAMPRRGQQSSQGTLPSSSPVRFAKSQPISKDQTSSLSANGFDQHQGCAAWLFPLSFLQSGDIVGMKAALLGLSCISSSSGATAATPLLQLQQTSTSPGKTIATLGRGLPPAAISGAPLPGGAHSIGGHFFSSPPQPPPLQGIRRFQGEGASSPLTAVDDYVQLLVSGSLRGETAAAGQGSGSTSSSGHHHQLLPGAAGGSIRAWSLTHSPATHPADVAVGRVAGHWTLSYQITRYRFCERIGRPHKSNGIMIVVSLTAAASRRTNVPSSSLGNHGRSSSEVEPGCAAVTTDVKNASVISEGICVALGSAVPDGYVQSPSMLVMDGAWRQRCWDHECQGYNFASHPLPPEVLLSCLQVFLSGQLP